MSRIRYGGDCQKNRCPFPRENRLATIKDKIMASLIPSANNAHGGRRNRAHSLRPINRPSNPESALYRAYSSKPLGMMETGEATRSSIDFLGMSTRFGGLPQVTLTSCCLPPRQHPYKTSHHRDHDDLTVLFVDIARRFQNFPQQYIRVSLVLLDDVIMFRPTA